MTQIGCSAGIPHGVIDTVREITQLKISRNNIFDKIRMTNGKKRVIVNKRIKQPYHEQMVKRQNSLLVDLDRVITLEIKSE